VTLAPSATELPELCFPLAEGSSCTPDLPFFFFSSRRRHTRWPRDWSSDVCSSDLIARTAPQSTQGILEIAHRRSRPLVQAHPSGSPPIGSLQDYAFVYDRPGACPGLTRKPDKKVIACDGASRCAHALEVGEFGLT